MNEETLYLIEIWRSGFSQFQVIRKNDKIYTLRGEEYISPGYNLLEFVTLIPLTPEELRELAEKEQSK